ncbi:MAG: DinB family protein [Flavobacteriales bacterium]|tara:strand:+ start:172 stop:687 length:516 start_codon:yes stop_codon:yes gene_type:complete
MREALKDHNFSDYFKCYISLVNDNMDVITALENTHKKTNELLDLVTEEHGNFAYADSKWTIKELLVHMIDTERIFCNRALRFARNDQTDLPGYDHDAYVPYSGANERRLCDICKEFNEVRESTIALFKSFTPEMLERSGRANGNPLTVLAIGFIISGHEIHHAKVMDEKYL